MPRPRSQSVTIAEIARHVGVSPSTVSIVLRGQEKERKISGKTVCRVRAAIKKLNYVPNHFARNLRLQRSGMIGVVIANFRADWAEEVMSGMFDVFDPSGYTPFVATHRFDSQRAHKELLSCLQRRDEGVICQPMPGERRLFMRMRDSGVPLIFLGDRPSDMPDVSFVGWDAGPAARLAVEHLIESGRKRIAFVGVDYPMEMSQTRFKAYESVLHETGLPRKEQWIATVPMGWAPERIVSWSLNRLFEPGTEFPDAIFALNDGLAMLLLEALEARGISVPADVALIGLGDLPMTGHRGIGLSTVREPANEMGRQAAELMLKLIAGQVKGPIHHLIPGMELRARRTTQPDGGG